MEIIYNILELFPFEMFRYDFMKNAFLALLILAPVFALLGTMTVNNRMAFFSDALGHSAFTGIGIGALLGMREPLFAMVAFGIFLSFVITKVKAAEIASADTVISVFSSIAMAVGILILTLQGGISNFSQYLVGDILTVDKNDLFLILMVLIVSYLLWIFIYNKLLLVSINRSLAISRGVNALFIENIFVLAVAIAVMISIRWVGILMINSLLILPAAAARNITKNAKSYHIAATVFAVVSSILGLFMSYEIGASAGACIVIVIGVIFFGTYLIGSRHK